MTSARMLTVPGATPRMTYAPSLFVCAPRFVPTTCSCAPAIGRCVVASVTRPVTDVCWAAAGRTRSTERITPSTSRGTTSSRPMRNLSLRLRMAGTGTVLRTNATRADRKSDGPLALGPAWRMGIMRYCAAVRHLRDSVVRTPQVADGLRSRRRPVENATSAPTSLRRRRIHGAQTERRTMRYMLMMHVPRGTGEYQIGDWSPDDFKAHIAFMHRFNNELT